MRKQTLAGQTGAQTPDDQVFYYTYSAARQDEVRKIREKYLPQEVTKLDVLRQLDRSVTGRGSITSLCLGTISTLALGIGMCCTMVWEVLCLFRVFWWAVWVLRGWY